MAALLGDPAGAWLGSRGRGSRATTIWRRPAQVREHLFAGDFYQANLTFGCDVAVLGRSAGGLRPAAAAVERGWGGVVRYPGGWLLSLSARAILHHPRRA